jgi:hypothetical protein
MTLHCLKPVVKIAMHYFSTYSSTSTRRYVLGEVQGKALHFIPFPSTNSNHVGESLFNHFSSSSSNSSSSSSSATATAFPSGSSSTSSTSSANEVLFDGWCFMRQALTMPLWEKCLHLMCVASDALIDDDDARSKDGIVSEVVTIMAMINENHVLLKFLSQIPRLVESLMRSNSSDSVKWLKKLIKRLLLLLKSENNTTTSSSSSSETVGSSANSEVQVTAAYVLGLLSRLCCNPPNTWTFEAPSGCGSPSGPRPIKLVSKKNKVVVVGGVDKDEGLTVPIERWKYFEDYWGELSTPSTIICDAAKCEIVKSFVAVIRHTPSNVLESQAPMLSRLLQLHWHLLFDNKVSPMLRITLAQEASVLVTNGAKVLYLLENATCVATQTSMKGDEDESDSLLQCVYLKHIEDAVNHDYFLLHALGSITRGIGSEVAAAAAAANNSSSALSSLSSSLSSSSTQSEHLILWTVLRLTSIWSNYGEDSTEA